MNPKFTRILILVSALAYIIWPFDLMPGVPIDDIIIGILGVVAASRSKSKRIE